MNTLTKNCKACGKEFKKFPTDSLNYWKEKIYCSKKCANNTNKNYEQLRGKKRPPEVIEQMKVSMFKKGFIPWNKNKPHLKIRGENHPFWKGGKTPETVKIRTSLEYKLWRRAIFVRDNFTCVWCFQKGGELHADHIQTFADFPELRFAIDNGRTLCKNCHFKRHGRKF